MVIVYLHSQKNAKSLRFRIEKEMIDRLKLKPKKTYKIDLICEIEGDIPKKKE